VILKQQSWIPLTFWNKSDQLLGLVHPLTVVVFQRWRPAGHTNIYEEIIATKNRTYYLLAQLKRG